MKTSNSRLFVLLAAVGGLLVSPLAAAAPGNMHQVDRVLLRGHPIITVGTSLNLVRQVIGSADEQLTPNLWLYHNFQPVRNAVGKDECCELVLRFVNERVASIHLADPRARDIMVARINRGAGELVALGAEPATTAPERQPA